MTPDEGAAAAVLDGQGRLLLVKENNDRRRYTLPGGAVEDGESALDAVLRETREENGVEVEIEHLVGVYRLVEGLTVLLFRCVVADGEPQRPESDEIAKVDWFAPGDIPEPWSDGLPRVT